MFHSNCQDLKIGDDSSRSPFRLVATQSTSAVHAGKATICVEVVNAGLLAAVVARPRQGVTLTVAWLGKATPRTVPDTRNRFTSSRDTVTVGPGSSAAVTFDLLTSEELRATADGVYKFVLRYSDHAINRLISSPAKGERSVVGKLESKEVTMVVSAGKCRFEIQEVLGTYTCTRSVGHNAVRSHPALGAKSRLAASHAKK